MKWPTAFEVRKEERLRGVEHYMSPKQWVGQIGLTFYCSMSVPLKVGLYKDHPFCPLPGFREVHTQVIGVGKMQQCYQKDIRSLYIEELMAPGLLTGQCMMLMEIIHGINMKRLHHHYLWRSKCFQMALVHQTVEVNMSEKILLENITFEKNFQSLKDA